MKETKADAAGESTELERKEDKLEEAEQDEQEIKEW